MKITASDVKNSIKYTRRIFFMNDYSEVEEERAVIDYVRTAEALNLIVMKGKQHESND